MLPPEYLALREKVDAFARDVSERAELTCRAGCDACCAVDLELCAVEADALEAAISAMTPARRADLRAQAGGNGCALLGEDGRCGAYDARPLVCRTQGLALLYPADTVPADAIFARAGTSEVTWCPLNFTSGPPAAGETLDAELTDRMLALVNRRHAGRARALERRSIRDIVEAATEAN